MGTTPASLLRRDEEACVSRPTTFIAASVGTCCYPVRIETVISEMNPDVVCLQELDVERARTESLDQAAEVARILEMDFHFYAIVDEASGRYGDAILSKLPVTVVAARSLPPVRHPFPRDARGAIWVEAVEEGRTWQITNTHFGLGHSERGYQATRSSKCGSSQPWGGRRSCYAGIPIRALRPLSTRSSANRGTTFPATVNESSPHVFDSLAALLSGPSFRQRRRSRAARRGLEIAACCGRLGSLSSSRRDRRPVTVPQ